MALVPSLRCNIRLLAKLSGIRPHPSRFRDITRKLKHEKNFSKKVEKKRKKLFFEKFEKNIYRHISKNIKIVFCSRYQMYKDSSSYHSNISKIDHARGRRIFFVKNCQNLKKKIKISTLNPCSSKTIKAKKNLLVGCIDRF